jgi:hypothetical protein
MPFSKLVRFHGGEIFSAPKTDTAVSGQKRRGKSPGSLLLGGIMV